MNVTEWKMMFDPSSNYTDEVCLLLENVIISLCKCKDMKLLVVYN